MSSSHPVFALIPASYLYLRRDDQVLLQQRAGTGYMDGHWVAGAAGHMESLETAQAAAVREAAEELSVTIAPGDLELLTVMHRTDGTNNPREQRVDWFWAATRWTGTPTITEPHKCSGLDWFDLKALPDPIPDYERAVLTGWARNNLAATTTNGFATRE